jgi:iron complex outermembrane receptor protein
MIVGTSDGLPAWAQAQGPAPASTERRLTFNIPAQELNGAILAFAEKTSIRVFYDVSRVQGLRSNGAAGELTPAEALGRLLAGTGLTFRFTAANAVELDKPPQSGQLPPGVMHLDPIQVQGYPVPAQAMIDNLPPPYAGGQVATGGQLGLLGNRPVMDTPFNQTSYTAKKAQDQQAKTLRDVLIDDPSVRGFRADGGVGADAFYIRGFSFPSGANVTYGGLYGMLPSASIMAELAERIEVLKGPSAMLNGMPPNGVIGGTVNVVPKRAPDEDLTQVTANYGSSAQFGGHADVARRFGADKQFGVRFNGVFKAGRTDVQYNSDQRSLAVLGLDFRGDHVRVAADLGFQYQYIGGVIPYLGVANGVQLPWAPAARTNPGGQPWGYTYRKDLFGVVRAEVDMTEWMTAYAAVGAHDSRVQGLYSANVIVTNFNGVATSNAPQNRSEYSTFLTAQAGLRALADTGPIGHEFAVDASTLTQDSGFPNVAGTAFATNIYNPTIIAQPNIATPAMTKFASQGLSSLGLADTLSAADKRIQLTVGARLQQVTAANFDRTTGKQTTGYDQSALSPSAALVFKPWKNVSLYGNWIQGLQQGTIVQPPFTNAGEVFPPFKSTQYEAGVKVDWGKFTTTASVFQISQPSILTDVAANTQFLGGEQRNQGFELNVFGEPTTGVRLLGGIMLLNAVLAKTQGGLTDGWVAPFSPGFNLNLAGEWDLPFVNGLTVNGRVIYTGSQYIDTTWPRRSLPNWTRFDLGVRYAFENPGAPNKLLVARFNVENVLDANYWAGGNGADSLFLGTPRLFRLSLTADF